MSSSSPPSAPEIEVPDPTPPQIYQAVIPQKDFDEAQRYIDELKADRENISYKTAVMVGTDEEIGQRYKERLAKIQSAYVSSLPQKETIPGQGIIDDAKAARQTVCQIANRRSDQAGLSRPTDCSKANVGVTTPPAPKTQAPQKPAPRPAPAPRRAPAPAPAPAPRLQVVRLFGESISNSKKNFARPLIGDLKNYGDHEIYLAANKAGVPKVNSQSDVEKVLAVLRNR